MTQYHLWLTPNGDSRNRLANLINTLSDQYRGPKFEPHITLLGELEGEESILSEQARMLANKLAPLSIDLQQPTYEDEYFRCVYFTVKDTPEIRDAHEEAKLIFGKTPVSPFRPHVSLLYGLFPETAKREVIASLPVDFPKTFLANDLKLIRAESLHLRDWSLVESISL